jgi:hypothetical protein
MCVTKITWTALGYGNKLKHTLSVFERKEEKEKKGVDSGDVMMIGT